METTNFASVDYALKNDPRVKSWIAPNYVLFPNSGENADLFLTTYRIRNAYELLLRRLEIGQEVTEEKDMVLVRKYFEMSFYPPKSMSLSEWKDGKDPMVRVVKAYKDRRWKGNRRRPYEITLVLSNGKRFQIDPGKIVSQFQYIQRTLPQLANS